MHRENDVDAAIQEREAAIRVGHHPGLSGEAARRPVDCRDRQVDADSRRSALGRGSCQQVSVAASEVDGHRVRVQAGRRARGDRVENGTSDAGVVEPAPRLERVEGVAGAQRAAIVRLQQVDIAAPRDVERVAARARPASFPPLEPQPAAPHGTGQRWRHAAVTPRGTAAGFTAWRMPRPWWSASARRRGPARSSRYRACASSASEFPRHRASGCGAALENREARAGTG